MRKWGLLVVLLLLSGCTVQQVGMDIEADAQIEAVIPAEVVAEYGMLQLEKKFQHLETEENDNGSVTVMLNEQEVEQIEQEVEALFTQYKQGIALYSTNQVTAISYDTSYQNIHFYVVDESVIYDENFLLTEEILMKHALAYQLIHGEKIGVAVLYYDKEGEHVLSKKKVPIQVSISN